jgi:hypothetical protein
MSPVGRLYRVGLAVVFGSVADSGPCPYSLLLLDSVFFAGETKTKKKVFRKSASCLLLFFQKKLRVLPEGVLMRVPPPQNSPTGESSKGVVDTFFQTVG